MYDPSSPSSNTASTVSAAGKHDVESPKTHLNLYDDPFSLRSGFVSPEQLAQLTTKTRKSGKKVQAYQRKQNKVNLINPSSIDQH